MRHKVSLTFWQDAIEKIEKPADSQTYLPLEASGGQEQYYIRSALHVPFAHLLFSYLRGKSYIPMWEILVLSNLCTLIFLLLLLLLLLFICNCGCTITDKQQQQNVHWYLCCFCYCVILLLFNCNCWCTMTDEQQQQNCTVTIYSSGQADIQSDLPPVEASSGHKQYYIRLTWHFAECNWEGSLQSDVAPW